MCLKNVVKQFKILFYFMEVKSLFKRKKKYETLLCLKVLYLVLQKSKPETSIKVMPLLENASAGVEDENKKGVMQRKVWNWPLHDNQQSELGPCSVGRHVLFTCEAFSARIIWRNHTLENTMKGKKKQEEECISLSSISHWSRIIPLNEISWIAGLCHPFPWQPLRKLYSAQVQQNGTSCKKKAGGWGAQR